MFVAGPDKHDPNWRPSRNFNRFGGYGLTSSPPTQLCGLWMAELSHPQSYRSTPHLPTMTAPHQRTQIIVSDTGVLLWSTRRWRAVWRRWGVYGVSSSGRVGHLLALPVGGLRTRRCCGLRTLHVTRPSGAFTLSSAVYLEGVVSDPGTDLERAGQRAGGPEKGSGSLT